ncbi:MAG: sterol desaturase family protein [Ferruginibacter sp.]
MHTAKIKNKGQARLFKNNYLEHLTKTHPLVIWSIYTPIIVFMIYYSVYKIEMTALHTSIVFIGGMVFWSFFEYIIHRYAFHFVTENEKTIKFVYLLHGNHHEYPRDRQRLFMPPVPSLLLAIAVFSIVYFIAFLVGIAGSVFAFFPGFMLGYLMYGTMHYAIHAWNPPFKWMKPLWRNHHLHHYKQQERGFGVSSTLWDHVFGTMFDLKKEKEDKEKEEGLMFVSKQPKTKVL